MPDDVDRFSPSMAATVMAAAVAAVTNPPVGSFNAKSILAQAVAAFDKALACGAIKMTVPRIITLPAEKTQGGSAVMPSLRIIALDSLGQKPTLEKNSSESANDEENGEEKKSSTGVHFDPFANVQDKLIVARHVGGAGAHFVMLNRFPAMRTHMLVVGRPESSQLEPLDADDFDATDVVLRDVACEPALCASDAVAFYNCGPASGYSVARRHVQVLAPIVVSGSEGLLGTDYHYPLLSMLRDSVTSALGFAVYSDDSVEACASAGGSSRYNAYRQLLAIAQRAHPGLNSHNVLFTTRWIALVPRRLAAADGIAVNGASYTGSLLARSDVDVEVIKSRGVLSILRKVGYPTNVNVYVV